MAERHTILPEGTSSIVRQFRNGERAGTRTPNLVIKSHLLYQLSYAPTAGPAESKTTPATSVCRFRSLRITRELACLAGIVEMPAIRGSRGPGLPLATMQGRAGPGMFRTATDGRLFRSQPISERDCWSSQARRPTCQPSGFRQRRPGNRLKSLSFEWTSGCYSMANAARWASVTRLAPTPAASRFLASAFKCSVPGLIGVRCACRNQPPTFATATDGETGDVIAHRWVINRTNPFKTIHGSSTFPVPLTRLSHQRLAAS